MGRRYLTCVVKGGAFKVAQYGQFDGYPSAAGTGIMNFIRRTDLKAFAQKIDNCRFGTEEELHAIWEPYMDAGGWMTIEQSNRFRASPCCYLSRETGYRILDVIQASTGPLTLHDQSDFARDGLFCEWCYVIDLDAGKIEVYHGFHKEPVPAGERFALLERLKPDAEYSPVHHVRAFLLSDPPSDDDFVAMCELGEEE